jgi:hypothetical protein
MSLYEEWRLNTGAILMRTAFLAPGIARFLVLRTGAPWGAQYPSEESQEYYLQLAREIGADYSSKTRLYVIKSK